jgi:hypothetical protein
MVIGRDGGHLGESLGVFAVEFGQPHSTGRTRGFPVLISTANHVRFPRSCRRTPFPNENRNLFTRFRVIFDLLRLSAKTVQTIDLSGAIAIAITP